jgi:hypothetical protein
MAAANGQKPQVPGKKGGTGAPLVIVFGLVKGGAIGAGAAALAAKGLLPAWLAASLMGLLVGIVAGRPFWRGSAWIATILKAIVGFFVGWGGFKGAVWLTRYLPFLASPWVVFPAVGVLWALLLEIDDAVGGDDAEEGKPAKAPPAKKA